jgi:hypothetical protein
MEEASAPEEPTEGSNKPLEFVSVADFEAIDVNAVTADVEGLNRWDVDLPIIRAANAADEARDPQRFRVLRLMAVLMSMHLRCESEGDALGPRWQGPDSRLPIPDDLRDAQAEVLAKIAPSLEHPTVRARVADVAYESGLRRAGRFAIDAYCDLASRLIDVPADPTCDEAQSRVLDATEPITRAFQINARVAKKGTVVERLAETAHRACDLALNVRAYVAFTEIGDLLLRHRLIDPAELAAQAEGLAALAPGREYRLPVKQAWLLAAEAHERAGNAEASRAASIQAIEKTLGMKDDVTASAAKAHWVKAAIREYRGLGGCQDRIAALKTLMRELQEASLDEFQMVRTKLDGLKEMREATTEMFSDCSLSDGLRDILDFIEPEDPEQQKAEALKLANASPLSNLFSTSHSDDQGRVVAEGPVLIGEEPSEAWFKEHCIRHAEPRRHYMAYGRLEPVRQTLQERFSVQERHMLAIVAHSDFVPAGHHPIYALGLARLWQGDYITAASLLIPQLENSLRYVLQLVGRDSSKMEEDGIQGDRPLNVLLTHCRADLEEMFGADMVWEIDALFNFRPGPALRHELAHGKLHSRAFYSPQTISALWLIYYLVVIPTLELWDSQISPLLEPRADPKASAAKRQ